jgi:hypothetical protein
MHAKLSSESACPAQYPPNDIASALVRGNGAIGNGKDKRPDMVGNDPKGVVSFVAELRGVLVSRYLAQMIYDGHEEVGVVVAFFPLQDGGNPFKTRACVNVPGWKLQKPASRLAIKLYKNKIP